jgi:hypothetical protein
MQHLTQSAIKHAARAVELSRETGDTWTIYLYTNRKTGVPYVGETSLLKPLVRAEQHAYDMENGIHSNEHMQALWDAGSRDWTFTPVATAKSKGAALKIETALIKSLPDVYNIRGRKGQKFGPIVLDDFTVDEVERRLALGDMGTQIAKDLGISTGSVSLIKNGKRLGYRRAVAAERAALCEAALADPARYANGRLVVSLTAKKHNLSVGALAWHLSVGALAWHLKTKSTIH